MTELENPCRDRYEGVPAGQHVVVPGGDAGFLQDALLAEFGYLLF